MQRVAALPRRIREDPGVPGSALSSAAVHGRRAAARRSRHRWRIRGAPAAADSARIPRRRKGRAMPENSSPDGQPDLGWLIKHTDDPADRARLYDLLATQLRRIAASLAKSQ